MLWRTAFDDLSEEQAAQRASTNHYSAVTGKILLHGLGPAHFPAKGF